MSVHWKKAGLLLVGHGSSRLGNGGDAVRRVAAALRMQNLFADVQAAFWREEPKVSLNLVQTERLYVMPVFAGHGKHTDLLIPHHLNLTGTVTQHAGRTILYGKPVGTHPAIPELLCRRAAELCHQQGLNPNKATLLLIGHGSSEGGAHHTPEAIAALAREDGRFAEVVVAYIEQAPFVHDWTALVGRNKVIAVPLLVSNGMHANEDLPPLFGLDRPVGGPSAIAGHRVWLMGGIGQDSEIAGMVLDLVGDLDRDTP